MPSNHALRSETIAQLLVSQYQRLPEIQIYIAGHGLHGYTEPQRDYIKFLRQESRTRGLRGRKGYQLALRQIGGR